MTRRSGAAVLVAVTLLTSACTATTSAPTDGAPPSTTSAGGAESSTSSTTAAPSEGPRDAVVANVRGTAISAHTAPSADSPVVAELSNPNPSGAPLVFQAVSPDTTLDDEWIEVLVPVRPNGTTGWIRGDEVDLAVTPFRVTIDTGDHLLEVHERGELIVSTPVGIGTGETPTPYGDFYLAELLEPPDPDGAYGPFAFGLSGFSEVLQTFQGGPGIVGIHGTNDPSSIGIDASNGCIRVDNTVITELARTIPLGTPVHITA